MILCIKLASNLKYIYYVSICFFQPNIQFQYYNLSSPLWKWKQICCDNGMLAYLAYFKYSQFQIKLMKPFIMRRQKKFETNLKLLLQAPVLWPKFKNQKSFKSFTAVLPQFCLQLSSSYQIVKLKDKINEKKGISLISQLIRKKFSTITNLFVK